MEKMLIIAQCSD
jgi:hypothetical protein